MRLFVVPVVVRTLGSSTISLRPYKVSTVGDLVLHDGGAEYKHPSKSIIQLRRGGFPVIIFSHGGLAYKDSYSGLANTGPVRDT